VTEPAAIAYFSMEIALESAIPTYAGGLGVLAGDTVLAAPDGEIPLIAVTLLHRHGYFTQKLDSDGWQHESPDAWDVPSYLTELTPRVTVTIEGRTVASRAWQFDVRGQSGSAVPVLLLDTDLPENSPADQELTHHLYGGDSRYRLCQELLLGIGSVRMLRALGYLQLRRFHMNEGHAALLALELLEERRRAAGRSEVLDEDIAEVRRQCVFTTHTPVDAGHDRFSLDLATSVLGQRPELSRGEEVCCDGQLNMTYLALSLSHYVNGVAKKHRDVSREMFPHYQIFSITNGVHVGRWTAPAFQRLFDRHIPGWREDNFSLRYALSIPDEEIRSAHRESKLALLDRVTQTTGQCLDPDRFTIGFARRSTACKRPGLMFHDLEVLRSIARASGGIQIVYAGKAHPNDHEGKQLIRQIHDAAATLRDDVRVIYVPGYDIDTGRLMTSGVDLWLNTPQPPLEASGTSGMKAALNGVPSLSVLDGWWIEGCIEGVTGWAIGTLPDNASPPEDSEHAAALYDRLADVILPLFYLEPTRYTEIMRHAIALNGSFFNTQRMVQQYAVKSWLS